MTTPQNTDEEPIGFKGPTRWRRIFTAIQAIWMGGTNTTTITVGAGGLDAAIQGNLLNAYRAKQQAADAAAKDRQEQTRRKRLMLETNLIQPWLEEKMRNAFHPENYARLWLTMHTSTNVMRRIVNETSKLYENSAKRSYKDESTDTKDLITQDGNAPGAPQPGTPPDPAADGNADPKVPPPAPPVASPPGLPPFAPKPPVDPSSLVQVEGKLNTGNPDVDKLEAVLILTGQPEKEETPLDKLMEAYDWDVLLDQVEKLCMACPVVWVRPYVIYKYTDELMKNSEGVEAKTGKKIPVADSGELCYIIYTPENAGVITHPNNPAKMIAWYYRGDEYYEENGEVKTRQVIHLWDDTNYTKYSADWQKILYGPEADPRGVNVAEFRINKPPVNSYYSDGVGDDLYEGTLEACVLKTLQNQRFKDGAFKQLAIAGQADKTMQDQVMGGPSPIFVGDEGTVQVLDLQANYDEMTNVWKAREEYLAVTYGIDLAEYKGEGHPQSGFAKKLAQGKVLAESKRRRKFFQEGEQHLYECTCRELEVNSVPDIPSLDITKEIVVDFSEPTFEEDPQNQAKIDSLNLEFHVISVLDILRRKNPDLTDIELIKQMHLNKTINDTFMPTDTSGIVKMLAQTGAQLANEAKPGMTKSGMGQSGGGSGGPPKF